MLKLAIIDAITKYIEDNLEKHKINTDLLSIYTGFSRRYLQLLFKKHLGIPIAKYIQLRRVSRAAILLKLTNAEIIDISNQLFYDSQQTFSREFKKNTGYTPMRYRKNKIWTFSNLTGYRCAGMHFFIPEIRYFEGFSVCGIQRKYKEKIPYTGSLSELRWNTINDLCSHQTTKIYLSNKVKATMKIDNELEIQTVYWTSAQDFNTKILLPEGFYIYFRFSGEVEHYIKHINNAYMNILPFYNLQRRADYYIETITRDNDNFFIFEYYLPITL